MFGTREVLEWNKLLSELKDEVKKRKKNKLKASELFG
jgi:hypothetical protein